MYKFCIFSFLCLCSFSFLYSHEGHKKTGKRVDAKIEGVHSVQSEPSTVKQIDGRPPTWMQWIGSFHFIFLHFPLALIAMTAVSEFLFAWYKLPIFDYSSCFMLISAAILAVPTALLGLTYSFTATYSGLLADFLWWHMWAGISTTVLVGITAFIREYYGISKLYYFCLLCLFLLINVTGFLGGGMTFGPYQMHPPL